MLFNESEIINLLIKLSEEEDFRLTIIEATKGAAMAGAGALFGALIAGPPGLVVGAAVGGVAGATQVKSFKPLATVISELPAHKKRELTENVNKIISSINYTGAAVLLHLVENNPSIRSQIVDYMKSFFGKVEGKPIQSAYN